MNITIIVARLLVQWRRPWFLFMVVFYGILLPLAISLTPATAANIKQGMPQPIAIFFLAMYVQQSVPAETEGYLALLYSRPLTRSSYMISRWAANTITLITICTLALSILNISADKQDCPVASSYILVNIALVCMEYSAITQLYRLLRPLGQTIFSLVAGAFLGGYQLALMIMSSGGHYASRDIMVQEAAAAVQKSSALLVPDLNTFEALNNLNPDWLPLISSASNTCLFLFICVFLATRRELSYAED